MNHVLTKVTEDQNIVILKFAEPGTQMLSCNIIATVNNLTITGGLGCVVFTIYGRNNLQESLTFFNSSKVNDSY